MAITSYAQLEKELNRRINIAVENVAKRMVEELESYIKEDFYNQYKPRFYTRTYELLKSPTYNMVKSNSAEVFIDMDVIHYLIGDPQYDTTEADIVKMASMGYHGNYNIFRPGMFWEDFLKWANNCVPNLLKIELRNQGLNVQ